MSYRVLLPTDVLPHSYDLSLEPDLKKYTFSGEVAIHCDVAVATDSVLLHATELVVHDASFKAKEGDKVCDASEIVTHKKETTVGIAFDEPLPTGPGVLTVQFHGILNDQMAGFYRSRYTRADGTPAVMGTTQFEPVDARRCFPCWDEPARKAVFNVTLTIPHDLTAVSNMPIRKEEFLSGDRRRVSFMPTPKMSPYLLAFCVGEFEAMAGLTSGGVLLRVLSVPGKGAQCAYALDCGVRALEVYNDFFGIPFPLPKMDMIAIPDFAAGAMENWGLITYREADLLCDVATVSAARQMRICTVVAHELAHQWFGNLVTMEWWDDLWLNEGFANWMQHFCSDAINPDWDIWTEYVGDSQQRALALDGLRTSHPIQVPIKRAQEVEEVFDAISYCKGSALVRMLYRVLGPAHFRLGLQNYFKRHAYGNTETTDLTAAWAEASGMPIPELVQSWTSKMGFPVLRVLTDPFENGGALEVEQQWFLADGSVREGDAAVQWVVPLPIGVDGKDAEGPLAFAKDRKTSVSVAVAGAQWVKLNYGQHVPCRVLYPQSMTDRLAAHLPAVPAGDRIGLLSDCMALCKAGYQDPAQLVRLLAGSKEEANDKVWGQMAAALGLLNHVLQAGADAAVVAAFHAFAARLVAPKARELGWAPRAGDSSGTKLLRQTLAGLLSAFCSGEEWVRADALALLEDLLADRPVPQDTRASAIAVAMRADATAGTLERLMAFHRTKDDDVLKRDIYVAVGKGPAEVQRRALEWCLTDAVKIQDVLSLPAGVAGSGPAGATLAFEWLRDSFPRIHGRLATVSGMIWSNLVRVTCGSLTTKERAAEVEQFWMGTPVYATVKKTVGQTREAIETNAAFIARLQESPVVTSAFWASLL